MRTGSLETDSARASKSLKQFQKDAEAAGKAVGLAFTAAGAGIYALLTNSIDAADHLNDLSKKTGIAADTLGGIGFAAKQAGGDLDSVAAGAGKLNKSLAEAAAGNEQAGEAFKALGINVKDAAGFTKSADVALTEIADKFAGYADGPEKAALALRLFGKAGADMIPLLDDGGAALQANIAYYKRYSGVTTDVSTASDQFNDSLTKIKLLSGAFGNQLAASALPLMQTLAEKFLGAKEQGDGFKSAAEGLVSVFKGLIIGGAYVADTFGGVGRELGAVAAQMAALAHGDIAGFNAISDAVKADGERAKKDLAAFVNDIQNPFVADPTNYGHEGRNRGDGKDKPHAPRLPGSGTSAQDKAAQQLKAGLDGQLKVIQDFEKSQASAYKIGESFLDGVYEDGLISQQDYFSAQKNLRDANLQNVTDAFDKEIAAQEKFIGDLKRKLSAKDFDNSPLRVGAEEKIKLAVQQRQEAVTQATGVEITATQANARAVLQLGDAYDGLRAQILSAHGDDIGAQFIKDAQELRQAAILIGKAGGDPKTDPTLKDLQATQQQRRDRMDLTKAYGKLLDDTARQEASIYLTAQTSGQGELETLAKIGDARQKAIGQLGEQAQKAADLAAITGDDADIKKAADLALAFKKASAELDPLAAKFRGIFTDAGSNAFADLLNGKTGLKGALTEFFTQVGTDINTAIAKELSANVFGQGGVLGDLGGVFSKAFGGKGLTGFQSLGVDPATTALQQLALAANNVAGSFGAPAAATSSGSGSGGLFGWIGSLFGGNPSAGSSPVVGSGFSNAAVDSGASLTANGFAGFDDGGYTGNKGMKDAVGVVHGQEYVFSAKAVKRIGLANLEQMHNGALKGYESGGFVGARSPEVLRMGGQGVAGMQNANGQTGDTHLLNVTNHFAITGPADRRTQEQIATVAGRAIQRALARGGA